MSKTIFEEKQTFNQLLSWLIFTIVAIGLVYQIWEHRNSDISAYAFPTIVFVLVLAFFLSIKLTSRIDERGIHVRMFPFHLRSHLFKWEEIENIYVGKYNPIKDYGGWGYRISFRKKGKAFSTKGSQGIKIELKNGKIRLIGTQKVIEAKACIANYFPNLQS